MDEYFKKLPSNIKDFIAQGEWEKRTMEVGKKYALNEGQVDDLINIVLLVLVGAEKPETFLETVISDLGISSLIADQISEDLGNRVFEYAIKEIGNKKQKVETVTQPSSAPKPAPEAVKARPPEVKPVNLPMVEKGETIRINKPPAQTPRPAMPKVGEETVENRINYKSTPAPAPKAEPVQRPITVPRINMATEEKTPATNISSEQMVNIIEKKLNNVTNGVTPSAKEEVKPEVVVEPKKYTVDPYREPIE